MPKKKLTTNIANLLPQLYCDRSLSLSQIGKELNQKPQTVWVWLKKLNIPRRKQGRMPLERPSKEKLTELYSDKNLPLLEIARFFGVALRTVGYWRHEMGIPTRLMVRGDRDYPEPSEEEKAWTAGFLDGEGCIRLVRNNPSCISYRLDLSFRNTHLPTMQYLKRLWGSGAIYWHDRSSSGRRLSFSCTIVGNRAYYILHSIFPYLVTKKAEAEVALAFYQQFKLRGHTGPTRPDRKQYKEAAELTIGKLTNLKKIEYANFIGEGSTVFSVN